MKDDLLIRFLEKKTTKAESLQVLAWIEAAEENRDYFKNIHTLWTLIQMDIAQEIDEQSVADIMQKIEEQKKKSISWRRRLCYIAATALLLMGLGYHLIDNVTNEPFDYESLLLSAEKNKEITLTINSQNKRENTPHQTITIPDSIARVNYVDKGKVTINDTVRIEKATQTMNTIRIPFGKRSVLILADGTKVYLNSGSTLIYPSAFLSDERRVYLDGEAFFEVKPDIEHKFIVQTIYKTIEVLGTSFNISVDREQDLFEAVLVQGRVGINAQNNEQIELSPNQYYAYTPSTQQEQIKEVDVDNYISWIEGKLRFRKEPMIKAIRKLEKVYNIKIELKNKSYASRLISGELNLRDSAEETMTVLMSIMLPADENTGESLFEISPTN